MKQFRNFLASALILAFAPLSAQVTLDFDASRRGPQISDLQYGIFYEEINNAGDGGLYAEMIRNRCFEDASTPDYWSAIGKPTLTITRGGLMNENRKAALDLKLTASGQGISNAGYWGVKSTPSETYTLSIWLKSDKGYKGSVTGSIADSTGKQGASGTTEVSLDGKWQKITIPLTSGADAPYIGNGRFELTFSNSGSLTIGMVSLFPKTFKDRENGCRIDLAEKLAALNPKFMRFPGGCYVEGVGTVADNHRFEWKKTICPVEQRPGHFNANWGYSSSDGLGFHEFLQLAEDLGAEPLFVVNVGVGHDWVQDYTKIDEYVQEALDAIEYCNGDISTEWGALRAKNGHPEPFNLRLLEIGNENYQWDDTQSDHYAERYKVFYDAIKARYPEITLIGNVEAWGTDDPSWRNSNPVEIVDEHYYRTPEWFVSKYNKYDSYDRKGPKVYAGEYAVTTGYGKNGHLKAALGEAVYMQGMENNSDICVMASYAPIFYNEERGGGWIPDMIRFNNEKSYGTPSYYVQKLMPEYLGKQNLKWSETGNMVNGTTDYRIGVSSWSTTVAYDNIKVTDRDGNILLAENFNDGLSKWTLPNNNWTVENGRLVQKNGSEQGKMVICDTKLPDSYTLELDAVKLSGAEGFLIPFNYGDDRNYIWWNIGGWGNTQHALQVCQNGAKSDYNQKPGSVDTGRLYHLKVVVDGTTVRCYIDNTLIHDISLPAERFLYVSSTIDDEKEVMYLKLVNTKGTSSAVDINIANAKIESAETVLLSSPSENDENTIDNMENVVPKAGVAPSVSGNTAKYEAPAYSLSIITFRLSDIKYDPAAGHKASESQIAALKDELASLTGKLSWLHATSSLPVMTSSGTQLTWSDDKASGVAVTSNRHSAQIQITSPNNTGKPLNAGNITANATFTDGAVAEISIPVRLAEADDWYGYLYTYMNSDKEITNMALGTKEGRGKKFEQLINGEEIFDTEKIASIEHGTRDAFMARGENGREFLLVTTDMCNAKSGVWNNFGIDLLRSEDLVHWDGKAFDFRKGKSIFSDSEVVTDCYKTDGEYARINRVWAPQIIWDKTAYDGKGAYVVYYSILSSNPGDTRDRIYYSYADKDFKTLTQPRLLFDAGVPVIDADIVFNPYDNLFHLMLKRSGNTSGDTGIYEYTSDRITGGEWTEIGRMENQNTTFIEAPTQVRRLDEDVYNMYFMRYDNEYSFRVADMDHDGMKTGLPVNVKGSGAFQHGSVIYVDKEEYDMLELWSKVRGLIRNAKNVKASTSTTLFDEAISYAEKMIADNRSVTALLEALPTAYEQLVAANRKYLAEGEILDGGYRDITYLIPNPRFDGDNKSGWDGTPFGGVSYGTAEHFNRLFDTYCVLPDMPAGTYRLEVQGFYRYGLPNLALPAHNNGTERLLAKLYVNGSESSVMSLYDEEYSSYPNNMGTAARAFNTDGKYNGNSVEYTQNMSGDLRIGVRKTESVDGDWTIFDNFRLLYKAEADGVDEITAGSDETVNVYSVDGILLKSRVKPSEATDGLAPGIYIIGGVKVSIKY